MESTIEELREALYLGKAIPEHPADKDSPAKACIHYRSAIALRKYNYVINDIGTATQSSDLAFIRSFAQYLQAHDNADADKMDAIIAELEKELEDKDGHLSVNQTVVLSSVYYYEERYDDALKLLERYPKNLECNALTIQTYLSLHRPELAQQTLDAMKAYAEDHIICQLAECWVNLFTPSGKYQTAFYTLEELGGSVPSNPILNAQAVSHMSQGRFQEASSLLQEIVSKNGNEPNAFVNLSVQGNLTGQSKEASETYVNHLIDLAPMHPYLSRKQELSSKFDKAAERFNKAP